MQPTDSDAEEPQLPGKDRNFVTALARGLELLRAFGTGEEYLGNAELSNRTAIPRPTVSRLTYTLNQLGQLQHNTHLVTLVAGLLLDGDNPRRGQDGADALQEGLSLIPI